MSGVGSGPWVIRGNAFHTRRGEVPVMHANLVGLIFLTSE